MFKERLREVRTGKHVSQMQLARYLNVSQQTIGRWEAGSASPNPQNLALIANYFQVSSDYLLETDMAPSATEVTETNDHSRYFIKFYSPEKEKDSPNDSGRLAKFISYCDLNSYDMAKRQEIGIRIKKAFTKRADKIDELLEYIDSSMDDLKKWEEGDFSSLDIIRLARLCAVMETSPGVLARDPELLAAAEESSDEVEMNRGLEMLKCFFQLSPSAQERMMEYAGDLVNNPMNLKGAKKKKNK